MTRSRRYSSGYRKPIKFKLQIEILQSYWPNINPDKSIKYLREIYPTLNIPNWVEGPFAMIRPGFFSDKYHEEVTEVLHAISLSCDGLLVNHFVNRMKNFSESEGTANGYKRLIAQQPESDILVVPQQFGIKYRGKSAHDAECAFDTGEFGEGLKNVGTMLLTHPNRLKASDDLSIYSIGDNFRVPQSDKKFRKSNGNPFWYRTYGILFIGSGPTNVDDHRYGTVSSFASI